MSVVLLDTSVASLLHPKKKADAVRVRYEQHLRGQTLALSFQSVTELWNWAEHNQWGDKKRQGLEASVRSGRRFKTGDCWIVATAVHRKIPLLTHDKDMVGRSIPDLRIVSYLP